MTQLNNDIVYNLNYLLSTLTFISCRKSVSSKSTIRAESVLEGRHRQFILYFILFILIEQQYQTIFQFLLFFSRFIDRSFTGRSTVILVHINRIKAYTEYWIYMYISLLVVISLLFFSPLSYDHEWITLTVPPLSLSLSF